MRSRWKLVKEPTVNPTEDTILGSLQRLREEDLQDKLANENVLARTRACYERSHVSLRVSCMCPTVLYTCA